MPSRVSICEICSKQFPSPLYTMGNVSTSCPECKIITNQLPAQLIEILNCYMYKAIHGCFPNNKPARVAWTDYDNNTWTIHNIWGHPVLKDLRQPTRQKSIPKDYNSTCPICRSLAYIGLNKIECSNPQCKGER